MLIKNKNPKSELFRPCAGIATNCIGILLLLPLRQKVHTPIYNGKTITVVIDAGHGGELMAAQ